MLREIIRPTSEFYNIHIPKEYINHEVEIMVLPLFELGNQTNIQVEKKSFDPRNFYGITSSDQESTDQYLSNNKNEWE